jgi:hypothetical protein
LEVASSVGLIVAGALLARPAPVPPAAAAAPRAERQASARAAVTALLAEPGGVIAFGELHQTSATAKVKSAIARFTEDILPAVAPHASHLIVETWITTGKCGESETRVTEDVARTTERPAETESEIMRLLRRAKELGVAPHVLDIACEEYEHVMRRRASPVGAHRGGRGTLSGSRTETSTSSDGGVDYDRLLTVTNAHLRRAIQQGLVLKRAPGRPLVIVYGGALHNDLHPDATLAKYTFGRDIHAITRGMYREIDLFVPEMVEATPALKKEPWYDAWRRSGAGTSDVLIQRSPRSAVIVFKRSREGRRLRGP